MENQNIQWENWEEQPQQENNIPTWGEQPQQENNIPTWGEQSQEDTPTWEWGNDQQIENHPQNLDTLPNQENLPKPHKEIELPSVGNVSAKINIPTNRKWSFVGELNRISINSELFQLNHDLPQAVRDLSGAELVPLGKEGRYAFSPQKDTELGDIIKSLVDIFSTHDLKIKDCFVYKNQPSESSLNIFRGKPHSQFVLFIQGDYSSGDLILDFSSLGGPSTKIMDTTPNHLNIIPGWVPFRISKNESDKDFVALVGTLDKV